MKTPAWLVPAIFVSGVVALWSGLASAKSTPAPAPKPPQGGNVQTATVGGRVYSVARLGEGTYLVSLLSTGGVLELAPVTHTFNQTGPLGDFGDAAKIAQLKRDLPAMQVNFGGS